MSRLERTVNLLSALVETSRPLTRSDIFERVPGYEGTGARRAFERDKELLRSLGVPVEAQSLESGEPDDQVGYRVTAKDYQLDDPGLTNDEISALAIATAAVRVGQDSTAGALLKLGADTDGTSVNDDVDLRDDDRLVDLFAARRDLCVAEFTYRDRTRHLEVHRLSFRRGRWYVSGFDRDYRQERTYRVDRITGAIDLSEPNSFEAPSNPSYAWLPTWRIGEGEPRKALLRVDAGHVETLVGQGGQFCRIESTEPDGSAVCSVEYVDNESLCSWMLDFLDHVEILEPADIRNDFVQRIRELVSQ